MAEPWRLALELAIRLAKVTNVDDYASVVFDALQHAFPADSLLWTSLNLGVGVATVLRGGPGPEPPLAQAFAAMAAGHPVVRSYLTAPHDLAPRPISDVTESRAWLRNPLYNEAFREGPDFTHEDLELARHMIPVLTLGWLHARSAFEAAAPSRPLLSGRGPAGPHCGLL